MIFDIHTWTFQFGCQMVAKGVSIIINHLLGFIGPERKVLVGNVWYMIKLFPNSDKLGVLHG